MSTTIYEGRTLRATLYAGAESEAVLGDARRVQITIAGGEYLTFGLEEFRAILAEITAALPGPLGPGTIPIAYEGLGVTLYQMNDLARIAASLERLVAVVERAEKADRGEE